MRFAVLSDPVTVNMIRSRFCPASFVPSADTLTFTIENRCFILKRYPSAPSALTSWTPYFQSSLNSPLDKLKVCSA